MAVAQQQMIQLNVRVDAEVKRQAEEVLELMGSSVTELVRMALEKVSHGALSRSVLLACGHAHHCRGDGNAPRRHHQGWRRIADCAWSYQVSWKPQM